MVIQHSVNSTFSAQLPTRIYKSQCRGVEVTNLFTRLSTLTYKQSIQLGKSAFGCLSFFNEYRLPAKGLICLEKEPAACVAIIPLMGGVNLVCSNAKDHTILSEKVALLKLTEGVTYTLSNPFEEGEVRVLVIGFSSLEMTSKEECVISPIILEKINEAASLHLNLFLTPYIYGQVGVYEGRASSQYLSSRSDTGVFCFVVQGAFEVQGRLIEAGDALSLSDTSMIDFESLSANAVLLVFEVPKTNPTF